MLDLGKRLSCPLGSIAGSTHLSGGEPNAMYPRHTGLTSFQVLQMMLSLPAGESHDEFVFSDTGCTFTKGCASLSHERLEQVTMITMFIRNFGWNPSSGRSTPKEPT